ncbi:helix-turn-helix domain-containing protein [Roseospirillum parvum]|uniref:Transcriptional regulator, contains XRE-family HTH domain n=1 Tax=Roseospirillum parvum TaxID=83401 RepID=A0A1G8G6I7_9PROT|nr:helix-turn-helix domain-containing protein [Roseospirillum parvum]SDH89901.1 Transcriptional regulator, contains XRE-family HTH domain [Roseospirillum parvum]
MNHVTKPPRRQPFTAKEYGPDPVDVHVGRRLRLRRTLLGMSQEQLAAAIGVTFQQVQKYERGGNRISASRLFDVARVLGVPISFFFEDITEETTKDRPTQNLPEQAGLAAMVPAGEADERSKSMTLELNRAFWRLPKDQLRTQVLDLLKTMARRD